MISALEVCDPYCVVSLLPGEEDKRQTQVQRNTLDPVFHESFSFPISPSELKESTLQVYTAETTVFICATAIYAWLWRLNLSAHKRSCTQIFWAY